MDGTPGSSLIGARYFYSFQFADLCLEALYWASYEKADNNIQSIVETIAGNVRVVRLREEPAKRRPALAWIPSLLRWGLGRQVSERFIVLFTWFDRFDHLHFAGATSSRSASLSRWRSSKRCGILRASPSRIRLSLVTTWGLASAGKVRAKCFNVLPFVNENFKYFFPSEPVHQEGIYQWTAAVWNSVDLKSQRVPNSSGGKTPKKNDKLRLNWTTSGLFFRPGLVDWWSPSQR